MKNKNQKEIPHCFYLWIQKRLYDMKKDKIKLKEAMFCLNAYRIPKVLRPIIFREMEQLGLIKKVNRFYIRIINIDKNEIDNHNKLYKAVGVWTEYKHEN